MPSFPTTTELPVSSDSSSSLQAPARPLQAAILLSAAYFLARVVGLIQTTIINRLLPDASADAYYAAFSLPEYVNYLVAGGAMSVTFIPIFTQLRQTGDERAAWNFFSAVATLMTIVLVLVVALGIWLAGPLVMLMLPGFSAPEKSAVLGLTISMTKVLLPAQIFFYMGGMIVGVLNAHKRFGATGFTGVVYNVVAIGIGLLLWKFVGAIGFAWGILVGASIGNFVLPLMASLRGPAVERLRFRLSFDWRQAPVRRFFWNALPIMLGVSLPVVDQVVVRFFASSWDDGAIRNLTTGNRFMLAPLGIVAQAASVAAFPYLASDSAAGDWTKFSGFLRSGLRRLLFLTLPLSVLLILLAQPLINSFRGGEFGRAAADETAVAFAFYCVGLFAWAGQQLVARGFYALQDTRTPTLIGSFLTIAFFIPLCIWMSRFGVSGLAMATSIGAAAHFVGVLIALEKRLSRGRYNAPLGLEKIMGTMLRTGVACIVMALCGLVAGAIATKVLPDARLADLLRVGFVSLVSCAAFAACAQKFSIPEWFWVRDKIVAQVGRRLRRAA